MWTQHRFLMLHHITRQILTSKRNTVITIMEYAEKTVRLCVANSPP